MKTEPFEVIVSDYKHDWYGHSQRIRVVHNGDVILDEGDYGEPEDKIFGRQFKWIARIIESAYALGKVDGKKEVAQYVLDQGFNFTVVVGDAVSPGSIDIRFPDSDANHDNSGG